MASPALSSQNSHSAHGDMGSGSVGASAEATAAAAAQALLDTEAVPVETLVKHLLAAKQSLSSVGLVLRANDVAHQARRLYEDSVVLAAQSGFLRHGIAEQARVLRQVRRAMGRAYDAGRREFRQLILTLDAANERLQQTMGMLRATRVESIFRPADEEEKCLMDFVDENSVDGMRNALKQSIAEMQAAQTSFDGDLLRFDDDLRALTKTLADHANAFSSPSASRAYQPMPQLLATLTKYAHDMAEHLTSLTRHFDMCVTAVRSTEGGAALARRRAAEVTQDGDPVSISGVITEQESQLAELEPMSPHERAEAVQVVVQDAPEVDEVVAEIEAVLQQIEADFAALREQADRIRAGYGAAVAGFQVLDDMGTRLAGYVAAESEFAQRWGDEKAAMIARMDEMDELRRFYEGYASAYDSLILEAERRRAVEDKIQSTLRKARESVDRLIDADWREREHFRNEIGEFLPTDLWVGMNGPLQRWEIAPVEEKPAVEEDRQEQLGPQPVDDGGASKQHKQHTPAIGARRDGGISTSMRLR